MIRGYKKAPDYKVQNWLTKELNLTSDQQRKISRDEILRFGPFDFIEQKNVTTSLLWRFTILFYPIIWFLILITLPFKFLLTGRWGYSFNQLGWFDTWSTKLGI